MINWICCGNIIKPRAACPTCGTRQNILECAKCGESYADTPLARDGVCPACIGAAARAKVYAEKPFSLLYDNGSGYYDCASVHETLAGAIKAAGEGWQTDMYITDDLACQNVVWNN